MWRIQTVFSGPQGSPWLNTFMFSTAVGTPQDAADAAAAFWTALVLHIHDSVSWTQNPDVEVIENDGSLTNVVSITPNSDAGEGTTDMLPAATQGLLRWRTGSIIAGREVRGRTFLPGMVEGSNGDSGTPAPGLVTDANNAAAALIADTNSQLVIWSRKNVGSVVAATGSLASKWAVLTSRRD